MSFEEAGYPDYIYDTLLKQGYTEPTAIQSQGWPMALTGRDFVGIAQTGSGKTIGVRGGEKRDKTSVLMSCVYLAVHLAWYNAYQPTAKVAER